MSEFSVSWLDLREPADTQARSQELIGQVLAYLAAGSSAAPIVDLGAGTG